MKKLIAIFVTILLLSISSLAINALNFNKKDRYSNAKDVNINNYIEYRVPNRFDNIRNRFMLKCKNISDTILVVYTQTFGISPFWNKGITINREPWTIMFRIKSKDNNPARLYFYYSTGAGGYIPKHLLPIFQQEEKNIDFWLKNVNIVKLIEENKYY